MGTLSDAPRDRPADNAQTDAEKWGLELAPGMLDRDEAEGVWPEHVAAVCAYLSVHTQWRILAQADGSKHAVGLDYSAVRAGLELAEIEVTAPLWADLQMIEIGARSAMNGDT